MWWAATDSASICPRRPHKGRACVLAARGFDDSAVQLWVESLFVFSVVWSVGATGDTEGREAFDTFFRCVVVCCHHSERSQYVLNIVHAVTDLLAVLLCLSRCCLVLCCTLLYDNDVLGMNKMFVQVCFWHCNSLNVLLLLCLSAGRSWLGLAQLGLRNTFPKTTLA